MRHNALAESHAEVPDKERSTPLDAIGVSGLRTTFFWPLTLEAATDDRPSGSFDNEAFLERQESWLVADGSPWQLIDDGLLHLPLPKGEGSDDLAEASERTEAMASAYGEFVYFHDFVQRVLFGKTGGKDAGPFRLFQRTDITALETKFFDWEFPPLFDVERVNLYLLASGVAVLAVQCRSAPSTTVTLANVLRFNDSMRRSHVPYFETDSDGKTIRSRGLPLSVAWHLRSGEKGPSDPDRDGVVTKKDGVVTKKTATEDGQHACEARATTPYSALFAAAPEDRRVLPAQHWRWLLNGKEDETERMPLRSARDGYRWRHFSDDRLPILTTVILRDRAAYYALSDGHWMRLAFVDGPGPSPYAYAKAFLDKTFEQHCYDRYHHAEADQADAPTRYLMCDYAMTAVTYGRGNIYADTLEVHMQRHYYQMFLLQVIDKAVMLGFSSRITRAVERFDGKWSDDAETDLATDLQDIERVFLQYVHRFRFTGISGQLQASEINAQLRGVMRLDSIFSDIKTELETAVAFLSARETERLGREARHATEAAERLNIIASLSVVIALVLGFFSMNILTTTEIIEWLFDTPTTTPWWQGLLPQPAPRNDLAHHAIAFGLGLMFTSCVAWGVSHAIAFSTRSKRRRTKARPAEAFVRRGLVVLLLIGLALAACGALTR